MVSILVPVYGTEAYIERCARSLFSQTYSNIEYVIVDDCTTDNAIGVIETILTNYPERQENVHIIHHKNNRGIATTRNTALDNAHGDFVMWVDSDDFVPEDAVENLVKRQTETDADIVFGGRESIFLHGSKIFQAPQCGSAREYLQLVLRRKTSSGLWAKLWRRRIYWDNNIRFPDGKNMEEDGYVSNLFLYYAKRIAVTEDIVYYYDCTKDGTATTFSKTKYEQAWEVEKMLEEFFNDKIDIQHEDVLLWRLRLVVATLTNCAQDGTLKNYFNVIKKEHLQGIDKHLWREVDPLRRFVLYVDNYTINKWYFRFMAWMKHSVLKQESYRRTVKK